MCCKTIKRYLFPEKKTDFYIRRRHRGWTIEVDVEPEGGGHAWEMVAITYCPFCGALLEA